jgi:hypothetical protein
MNGGYEVIGRVHTLRQRRENTSFPAIDGCRDLQSFDIEFSPEGLIQKLNSYTNRAEFDGSELYFYDDRRRLVRIVQCDKHGAETGSVSYEPTKDTGLSKWEKQSPSRELISRGEDEYRNDKLIVAATFQANGLPLLRENFEYDGNKLARSNSAYYGISGSLAERWTSTYDSAGRLAETYGLTADGEALGDGLYKYEYDSEGRKSRVLSFNDRSDSHVPNGISEFFYRTDQDGNWIERLELSGSSSDDRRSERLTWREIAYYPAGGR